MKKDLKRAALAAIFGALAFMTACGQNNGSSMNDQKNGMQMDDQERNPQMDMDSSAKPMPGTDDQMDGNDQDQMQGGYQNGNQAPKKHNGSQYHYYCD